MKRTGTHLKYSLLKSIYIIRVLNLKHINIMVKMFFSDFCLCFIFQFRLLGWYSESFDPCPQAAEIKFLSQTFLFALLFFLVFVPKNFSNKKNVRLLWPLQKFLQMVLQWKVRMSLWPRKESILGYFWWYETYCFSESVWSYTSMIALNKNRPSVASVALLTSRRSEK